MPLIAVKQSRPKRSALSSPAYHRIGDDLRARVTSGDWPVGTMLPSRKDLAREYGVSVPTVERAIADLLEDRTLRADKGRGTFVTAGRDNGARQAVSPAATATVGVVAHLQPASDREGVGDAWAEIITNSLERTITRSGGLTHFFNLFRPDGRVAGPAEALEALQAEGVNGVAFVLGSQTGWSVSRSDLPLVFVGGERSPYPAMSVYYDNENLGYQAAHHLLQRGVPDLLFFAPYTAPWVRERLEGVRQAVTAAVGPAHPLRVSVADADIQAVMDAVHSKHGGKDLRAHESAGYAAARALLAQGLPARGVITANDYVAFGFRQAAEEVGLTAGRDYALVGFDDHPEARAGGLTSLHPPLEALGREAGLLLLRALEGQETPMQVCLHSHLVARASSRRLP